MNPLNNTQSQMALQQMQQVQQQQLPQTGQVHHASAHHKAGHHERPQVELTGKANFLSTVRVNTTQRNAVPRTLTQRLQRRQTGKTRPKNDDLSAAMHKLLEEMAADGEPQDMGDQRRDPLEELALIQSAQEHLESLKVPDEKERAALPDGDLRKTLTHEKKEQMQARLDARLAKLEKREGEKLTRAVEHSGNLQELFDRLSASGHVQPHLMEQMRPLFSGGRDQQGKKVQAFSARAMAKAFCQGFGSTSFDDKLRLMQKHMGEGMRPQHGSLHSSPKAARVWLTGADAYAFHQLQSAHRIARQLHDDLVEALSEHRHQPRGDAGQLTMLVLEVPPSAPRDGERLLQTAAAAEPAGWPEKMMHKVCQAYLRAIESIPMHWWPENTHAARLDLIDDLRSRLHGAQASDSREQKTADLLEKQLRAARRPA